MSKLVYSEEELLVMSPKKFRSIVRRGEWTGPDINVCRGYVMANLAVVPKDYAFEFLLFFAFVTPSHAG